MVRILGNNLAEKKKAYIALTSIYGVGLSFALKMLSDLKIDQNLKIYQLTDHQITLIRIYLEDRSYMLEGDLKKTVALNIKRLIELNSYRGKRHLKGLPVRGQRTRTNNRTSRKKNTI